MYLVPSTSTSAPPRTISGRSLSHRKLTIRQRAALAAQLSEGEVAFKPSVRQAAQLFGVSTSYVHAAKQLQFLQRAFIADGRDTTLPIKPQVTKPVTVSDARLTAIIQAVGVDRVLAMAAEVEDTDAVKQLAFA
jgi:hypothetical protein